MDSFESQFLGQLVPLCWCLSQTAKRRNLVIDTGLGLRCGCGELCVRVCVCRPEHKLGFYVTGNPSVFVDSFTLSCNLPCGPGRQASEPQLSIWLSLPSLELQICALCPIFGFFCGFHGSNSAPWAWEASTALPEPFPPASKKQLPK